MMKNEWISLVNARYDVSSFVFRRVRKIAKSDYQLCHVCLSVRMKQLGSSKDGFPWNLVFEYFYKICREISISTKIREEQRLFYINILHKHQYIFMIISRWILLRIIIFFSDEFVEKFKLQILYSVTFPENHAVY